MKTLVLDADGFLGQSRTKQLLEEDAGKVFGRDSGDDRVSP